MEITTTNKTARTSTGTYRTKSIGKRFFAIFEYNDGEVLFLSKPYIKEANAQKRLQSHCNSANVTLQNN